MKFRRQHPSEFEYENHTRHFIADFYCADKKLIVEIDGGIHEQQKDYDLLRTEILNKLNYRVIRFSNQKILDNINETMRILKKKLLQI